MTDVNDTPPYKAWFVVEADVNRDRDNPLFAGLRGPFATEERAEQERDAQQEAWQNALAEWDDGNPYDFNKCGSADSPSSRSGEVPTRVGTEPRVGRGGVRRRCGPKPLYPSKTKGIAVTDGQQTVPQGVPDHDPVRPRTGNLVRDGHRSPCPADWTRPVREGRSIDGERDAMRLSVRGRTRCDGDRTRGHVQLNCRCRPTAPTQKGEGRHKPPTSATQAPPSTSAEGASRVGSVTGWNVVRKYISDFQIERLGRQDEESYRTMQAAADAVSAGLLADEGIGPMAGEDDG